METEYVTKIVKDRLEQVIKELEGVPHSASRAHVRGAVEEEDAARIQVIVAERTYEAAKAKTKRLMAEKEELESWLA